MNFVYFGMGLLSVSLAWLLAKRQHEHRSIAWLLTAALVAEFVQRSLDVAVLEPLRAELGVSSPWTGSARFAGHVADALWLVWPFSLMGTALKVFVKSSPRYALVGWVIAVVALVVTHPIAGNGSQGLELGVVQAITIAASAVLGVVWSRRRTDPATPAHVVLAVLVANELVSLLAALWAGPFERWSVMQASAVLVLCIVNLLQGRSLWATKLSLSSPSP